MNVSLRSCLSTVVRAVAAGVGVCVGLASPGAWADAVVVDPRVRAEAGYAPVAELAHEVVVEPQPDGTARVRYRLALNNASAIPRDAVVTWGVPASARLSGFGIVRDGRTEPARPVRDADRRAYRDDGTIFVRRVTPGEATDPAAFELVAFGLWPEHTVQVEVVARVRPALRAGRFVLSLPERGTRGPALASRRRVLVRRVAAVWVDGASVPPDRAAVVPGDQGVEVAWPAPSARPGLSVAAEYRPDGFGGSQVRIDLAVGPVPHRSPDAVALLVDRSVSADPRLPDEALTAFAHLARGLSPGVQLAAYAFARKAVPLSAPAGVRVEDFDALRASWRAQLLAHGRRPGTDIAATLETVLHDLRRRGARRPLLVVASDGMFPSGPLPRELTERLRHADVLLLADVPEGYDPPSPDHPVMRFAAATGSRLSPLDLAAQGLASPQDLLASPRVLAIEALALAGGSIRGTVPPFVAGGTGASAFGRVGRMPPGRVRVVARAGGRRIVRSVRPRRRPPEPSAFGLSLASGEDEPVRDGFALPPWYGPAERRSVLNAVVRAGRGGEGPRGRLTAGILRNYLRLRVLPRVRVCHRHAVARHRDQAGRVVLRFEIARGEVMRVDRLDTQLAHDDPRLLACLEDAAWALDVPAARRDDRVYVVRYPVRLLPARNGVGPALGRGDEATLKELLEDAPRHTPRRRDPQDTEIGRSARIPR